MSKNAGKKGTRPGKPRGSRGTGGKGGKVLAHIFSFITGAATAVGGGAAIQGAVESTKTEDGAQRELHPAVDAALSTGAGMTVSGLSAAAKPLRPFVWSELGGNVAGGSLRGLIRWLKNRPKAANGNVAEALRRKRLADGAKGSVADTMRANRLAAMERRYASTS